MATLWYRKPAELDHKGWEEDALPLGNGQLGCKVFGGISKERIQLNEKSLWSGTVLGVSGNTNGNGNGDFGKSFSQVRQLLKDGKMQEAKDAMGALQGDEVGLGAYQNMGDLWIETQMLEEAEITNYSRGLHLDTASAYTEFSCGKGNYRRDYFATAPGQVIVLRQNGRAHNLRISLQMAQAVSHTEVNGNYTIVFGQVGKPEENGLQYALGMWIETDGVMHHSGALAGDIIQNATETTIYLAAMTNYGWEYPHYRDFNISLRDEVRSRLKQAADKRYETLYQEHLADYCPIYSAASLSLGSKKEEKSTDELVADYKNGCESRKLEELLFQYGRYMLIASSRKGSLPANLQGVWNDSNTPVWQSDYHLDINLQMNYWLALNTNLPQTMFPLFDYVNKCLVVPGRVTAYCCTGIGDPTGKKPAGWMVHTQNNIFGHTGPGSVWRWGWLPANGPFLLQNLFEYYRFTQDVEALEKYIYPAMEECAGFWSKLLVEDTATGCLLSSPCSSPEHGPVTAGATYDQTMIWQLYTDTIEAANALKENGEGRVVCWDTIEVLKSQLPRLAVCEVGQWGQIKEWREEDAWENRGYGTMGVQPQHRHPSHLLGLYPGHYISKEKVQLRKAVEVSLNDRGEDGPGWMMALHMGLWARLGSGNRSFGCMQKLIRNNLHNNLWSYHPPFQIDGNLGLSAAVAEMLLQSEGDEMIILPALPKAWQEGSFRGLVARGGCIVSVGWREGKATSVKVFSPFKRKMKIHFNGAQVEIVLEPKKETKVL